jgi:rare lipoprotein A
MKKHTYLILFCCLCLVACGGKRTTKPAPIPAPPTSTTKPPVSSPAPSTPTPSAPPPTSTPQTPAPTTSAPDTPSKPGGYYLDDGPEANPPQNLDDIPNAVPKKEPLLSRSNRPYKALGATYTPLTRHQPYKAKGVASWYGKRFHGKKTSSGEVYDMYAMSAAHTILPLPSYVKVTNPANGRSVIVRVNDRGPFKHNREIDLSYAAAYKLRFISKGSTAVEVEAIDPSNVAYNTQTADAMPTEAGLEAAPNKEPEATNIDIQTPGIYVQAGAFKNEANAEALLKKIQGLGMSENVGLNRVYNNNLHRLKLGPYNSRAEADEAAANIRRELNIPAITINQ